MYYDVARDKRNGTTTGIPVNMVPPGQQAMYPHQSGGLEMHEIQMNPHMYHQQQQQQPRQAGPYTTYVVGTPLNRDEWHNQSDSSEDGELPQTYTLGHGAAHSQQQSYYPKFN